MSQQCCDAVLRWKSSLRSVSCNIAFRLSQSRSLGFLVWCGRTRLVRALRSLARAPRSYDRGSRSKARLVSKSTSPLEIGAAQLRSVREIAPKPVSLFVNWSRIRHGFRAVVKASRYSEHSLRKWIHGFKIRIGNSMICSDIWRKYHEWYFEIVIRNFTSR